MLNVAFSPMVLEPKQFSVGDTIRVTVSFQYTVAQNTTVTLQAVPYQYKLGFLDRIGASAGKKEVSLMAAATPRTVQESIDFTLKDISAGTYGLLVEVPDTGDQVKQDGLIIVVGAFGIMDMIPMLMMVMMLGMVMPMLEGEGMEME